MDADPGRERAPHEGLVAGPGRRGGPRRSGVGHGQRRQHRRHDGQRPAAHGPDQGRARPAIATPIPVPGGDRPRSCSTPAPTPSATPSGSCSSPRWAPCTPASASASPSPRVALLSIGEEPTKGNAAGQGDPRAARRGRVGRRRRGAVRRQRRGPRPHERRRRRRRHRRLHRQRGPQDPRGRAQALARRRRSSRRSTPPTRPGPRRPSCSAGARAALRPARSRDHRRRHAARRRRGVHHQPRLVVGHGHRQRRAAWPGTWCRATSSGISPAPCAPSSSAPEPLGRPRSQAHERRITVRSRRPRPDQENDFVPAETHVEQAPMGRQEVLDLIRDRLADILEIEPDVDQRGRFLRRRPRRRLARPDRAGRGARGGARRADASASASTTRTSRT